MSSHPINLHKHYSAKLSAEPSKLVLPSCLLGGYGDIQRLGHDGQGDRHSCGLICGLDGDHADDLPGRVRGHDAGRPG